MNKKIIIAGMIALMGFVGIGCGRIGNAIIKGGITYITTNQRDYPYDSYGDPFGKVVIPGRLGAISKGKLDKQAEAYFGQNIKSDPANNIDFLKQADYSTKEGFGLKSSSSSAQKQDEAQVQSSSISTVSKVISGTVAAVAIVYGAYKIAAPYLTSGTPNNRSEYAAQQVSYPQRPASRVPSTCSGAIDNIVVEMYPQLRAA
jgi:hypothetical protein